jgi:radical SAM protein with 4Fe4S-binding SPASM domain
MALDKSLIGKFRGYHNMEITTTIGCKNMCSYCANAQIKMINAYKGNRVMSFDVFKKILSNIPKDVELYFAGHSEPFLNPESSLMMRYAIEHDYTVVVYSTLEGFSENDLHVLKNIQSGGFHGFAFHRFDGRGYNRDVFNWKQNIIRKEILGIEPIPYDDDVSGRVTHPVSRAGTVWDESNKLGKLYCSSTKAYDNNSLMPNGDVYLCCMDYGLKHRLGNLLEKHYNELDRSKIFELASQQDSDIICRKCVVARYI